MDYIELSHDTAPTARRALPSWSPLSTASVSTGLTAGALDELQRRTLSAIETTSNAACDHCASIAAFADSVCESDAQLASDLQRLASW